MAPVVADNSPVSVAGGAAAHPYRFTFAVSGVCTLTIDLPDTIRSLDGVEVDVSRTEVRFRVRGDPPMPQLISLPSEAQRQCGGEVVAKFSCRRHRLVLTFRPVSTAAVYAAAVDGESGGHIVAEGAVAAVCSAGIAAMPSPSLAADVVAATPAKVTVEGESRRTQQDGAGAKPSFGPITDANPSSEPWTRTSQAASRVETAALSQPEAACIPAKPPTRHGDNSLADRYLTSRHESGKAYGSVWNANSWHWEEKNCMDLVRTEVRRLLCDDAAKSLRHVVALGGAGFLFSDIETSGEASFSLRRGKRILCFELAVAFRWECRDEFGGQLGARGTASIVGITQDEDSPEASVVVSTSSSSSREARSAVDWLKSQGTRLLSESFGGSSLAAKLIEVEEARSDAEADIARRLAEKEAVAEAQRLCGGVQSQIAAEQQQREKEFRQSQPSREEFGETVQGSIWNVNAWHWEERPMTEWSRSWLERELACLSVNLLSGLAEFTVSKTQVCGDASVSVRKGRPICLFQLSLECRWAASPRVDGLGEAIGKFSVPEFTSEDPIERVTIDVEVIRDQSKGRLTTSAKAEGAPAVRKVLFRFADALRGQLGACRHPT
eukprot:TRINITY_DN34372_c0_g1_i1.p1 TRINITY_DN34372_c0_g1~~TRINITY_DN34372_c0_g1_i1.p1  ORF type:complete len:608 (+),score=93.77 TRINITY_DN34372_c0_g1_i1:92-1915(+)